MMRNALALAMLSLASLVVAVTGAQAAEVKCLCPLAMRAVFAELGPEFERTSGHKLTADFATLGVNADRITRGEPWDVAVLSPKQVDELEKQGRLLAGSHTDFARVGYGAVVRKNAVTPDIASVEGLKRALLGAKSVSYGDPAGGGPAGIYIAGLMERLGVAAELKPKTKLVQNAELVVPAVASGEAEIGFTLASSAKASTAVEYVPLPAEVQNYTVYVAALVAHSTQIDAARALITFLASPAAREAMKAKGFEPR